MVGFCSVDVKPFGPDQAYVPPATVCALSVMIEPLQNGPPFEATGVAGPPLATTPMLAGAEVQPLPSVVVTVYVPVVLTVISAVVAPVDQRYDLPPLAVSV